MSEQAYYSLLRGQSEEAVIEALERVSVDAIVDHRGEWTIVVTTEPSALRDIGLGPALQFESQGQDPGCPWSLSIIGGEEWSSHAPELNAASIAVLLGCTPEELSGAESPWALGDSLGVPLWPMLDARLGVPSGVNRGGDLD